MADEIKEYQIELNLDSGARLKMLMFDHSDHRWIFDYRYIRKPKKRGRAEFVNDVNLMVNYKDGISQNCELSMSMVRPGNLGKKYLYGLDVSDNAKIYLEFIYEKQKKLYKLVEVKRGAFKSLDLRDENAGLIKPIDFPFPIKDTIENKFGDFEVPFLNNDDQEVSFKFPNNYTR